MNLKELPRVTSARAAEIVGVGYEGFRSYLKRGLLGRAGMLPGFHAPNSPASDDPAPRSGWKTFGLTDLTLMRLAKKLMDAGFSFAAANSVISHGDLWSSLQGDEVPSSRYLVFWPPYGDYMLFEPHDLHLLGPKLAEAEASGVVVTLINLGDIQRDVAQALAEDPGSAEDA